MVNIPLTVGMAFFCEAYGIPVEDGVASIQEQVPPVSLTMTMPVSNLYQLLSHAFTMNEPLLVITSWFHHIILRVMPKYMVTIDHWSSLIDRVYVSSFVIAGHQLTGASGCACCGGKWIVGGRPWRHGGVRVVGRGSLVAWESVGVMCNLSWWFGMVDDAL